MNEDNKDKNFEAIKVFMATITVLLESSMRICSELRSKVNEIIISIEGNKTIYMKEKFNYLMEINENKRISDFMFVERLELLFEEVLLQNRCLKYMSDLNK